MKTLCLIVPIYNESRTIEKLIQGLLQLESGTFKECIFVDDGSTDKTLKILSECLQKVPFDYEIISKPNGGKSSAIREGIKVVSASHVLIFDADLEQNPADIKKLWSIVLNDTSNYVFGYRQFLAQSAFTYRYTLGNRLISNWYGFFFNQVITDIMCGLKLVPIQFLRELDFKYKNFGIEIEIPIAMWRNGIRPYEIPVDYSPRSWTDGKSIGVRDALQIIFSIALCRIKLLLKKE
jgi:glycosyltransferase involved in cell wall biosynthesis